MTDQGGPIAKCPATNPWGKHEWSHYPENPTRAVPRPHCIKCGLDIDNQMSPLFSRVEEPQMPDLINSLADSLIALINANPRSPTKDEIAALLGEYLFVQDSGSALYKLPGKHCELPEPITDLSEAALEKAAEIIKLNLRLEAELKAYAEVPTFACDSEIERRWAELARVKQERDRQLANLKHSPCPLSVSGAHVYAAPIDHACWHCGAPKP